MRVLVPFVVGMVNGVSTVGINGQLVVDGTITARHIQAQTIGAQEINAQSVWAGIVSADRVFASKIATSGDLNWRVEIEGNNATYPFWYGQGVKGGSNSVFFFDRSGNTWLAGNLNVTGAGRFSTSAGATDARVEIGGNDGLLMWAGTGVRNTANAKFYFTATGNLVIRGNVVNFPFGSGSGNSVPRGTVQIIAVEGRSTVPVLIMGRSTIHSSSGVERGEVTEIKVNGTVQATYGNNHNIATYSISEFAIVNVPSITGTIQIEMAHRFTAVAGGNAMPTFNYVNSYIFGLQLATSS